MQFITIPKATAFDPTLRIKELRMILRLHARFAPGKWFGLTQAEMRSIFKINPSEGFLPILHILYLRGYILQKPPTIEGETRTLTHHIMLPPFADLSGKEIE